MYAVSLTLFGGVHVEVYGRDVAHRLTPAAAVVVAALGSDLFRGASRSELPSLFWPEIELTQGRRMLNAAIAALRDVLHDTDIGEPFILLTRRTVQFAPNSRLHCDVREFSAALSAVNNHSHAALATCEECIANLERAVALYRGPLFHECLPTAFMGTPIAERLALQSERLRGQARAAVEQLAAAHVLRGDQRWASELRSASAGW